MRNKNKMYAVLCASLVLTLTGISVSSAVQQDQESSPEKTNKNVYYFKKILENEINFLKEKLKQQESQFAALEEQKKRYEAQLSEQKQLLEKQKQELAAAAFEAKIKLEGKDAEQKKRYEVQLNEQARVLEKQKEEDLTVALEAKKKQEETDLELLKQKAQYETLLGEYKKISQRSYEETSLLAELKSRLEQLQADYDKQSKAFEQVLVQKALEQEIKISTISEQVEKVTAIAVEEKKEMRDVLKLLSEKTAQISELQEEKKNLNARFAQLEKDYAQKISGQQKEYESRLQMILSPNPDAAESQLQREQDSGQTVAQNTARDTQIKALQQQVNDLNEAIEKTAREHEADLNNERQRQKAMSEQQLARKDVESKEKHKELIEKYRKEVEDARKVVEQKLADKYQQFDDTLRKKEKFYNEQLNARENEITVLRAQTEEKEKTLRQMIAKNELDYNSNFEEQKRSLEEKIFSQQKLLEQLKMYQVKLKDELNLQSAAIAEKDNHIVLLTKKLAMDSGEEYGKEENSGALMKEEFDAVKKEKERLVQDLKAAKQEMAEKEQKSKMRTGEENLRLMREVEALKTRLVEEKSSYEEVLTLKQRTIQDLQQVSAVKSTPDTQDWEKKMQLIEKKYLKQIGELELQKEKIKEEYELKLQAVAERMRTKVAEDEKLKR